MHDESQSAEHTDGILLARVNGTYWLIEGEAHLNALLMTTDGFPTPVRCMPLASMDALGALEIDITEAGKVDPCMRSHLADVRPAFGFTTNRCDHEL